MSFDISTMPLKHYADNISRPFKFKGKEKVIFINTGDVLEGKFLHSNYTKVEDLPGQAKKAIEYGDILYSEIRPGNRRFAFVDFDAKEYVVSTKFMVLKSKNINPKYLYLILTNKDTEDEFKTIADSRSGTFPQITFDSISHYPIIKKDKEQQEKAIDIAFSISNLIDNNNYINQTLETIAQTLFKSWFVDFDPVKAKIAAKEQGENPQLAAMMTISGKTADEINQMPAEKRKELADTADLFPDEMMESELGWIPKGWKVLALYDTAEYVNGGAFKANDFSKEKQGLPIIKIAELKSGISNQTEYTLKDVPEKYRINSGDILYSWSGSPETSLEAFKWFGGEGWLNQHIFKINTNSIEQKVFVYFLLKYLKPLLIEIAKNKQTTGLGHVTVADMKRIKIVFPDKKALKILRSKLLPTFQLSSNCIQQNYILSNQRDTLLPKLLSGEIRPN